MTRVWLPSSLEELWPLWAENPGAALYAGGTDLLVRRRAGLVRPEALICLERVAELGRIEPDGPEVFLGAGASFSRLLSSPLVTEKYPVLAAALQRIGSPQVRHMGTLGGNLVTASPAGDSLPPLYTLDAVVELVAVGATRRVPIAEFIQGPGQVDLRPGELVSGVRLPATDGNLQHFEKVGSRAALAISIASLAVAGRLSDQGEVLQIKLAWGSVGPTVVCAPAAEAALQGKKLTPETLAAAGELAQQAASPIDDLRASREYRLALVKNLLLRLAP